MATRLLNDELHLLKKLLTDNKLTTNEETLSSLAKRLPDAAAESLDIKDDIPARALHALIQQNVNNTFDITHQMIPMISGEHILILRKDIVDLYTERVHAITPEFLEHVIARYNRGIFYENYDDIISALFQVEMLSEIHGYDEPATYEEQAALLSGSICDV